MNDIRILSHAQLEAYTREEDVSAFVAVVVYSQGKDTPYIEDNPRMEDVLFELFDDTEDDSGMTPEQAGEIAAFIRLHENDDLDLIVSCRYGESRSAGIAAAIIAYLDKNEMSIWANPDKTPNMRCYELMCTALDVERSERELRELFLTNTRTSQR